MDKNKIEIYVERVYSEHFSSIEKEINHIDSPALLGYHTPAYMNALTSVLNDNPLYLVAYREEKIVGILPLRWCTGNFGPVINGLPFFGPNGGPILTEDGRLHTNDVVEALCRALMEFSLELQATAIALYTPFLFDVKIIEKAFYPERIIDKFTQYIKIANHSLVWPTRSRRAVSRAKINVSTRLGTVEDLPNLLNIYYENCSTAGIPPKPEEYFYQVIKYLCPAGVARFTIAEYNERIVACLITIQSGTTVSYNVPCSRIKDRSLQANSLLIDEAVHYFQSLGYKYWNWESSPSRQHPVYEFKYHWGSDEAAYQIMIRYPKGFSVFSDATSREIASSYPFYFVVPFNDLVKF